mmetsp:Transcript_103380/g.299026  ORF Transcript_103380/g.299026 Transcript_103380/m.299026 type:complete len:202 (-) Transcript_103380:159-764(-)
MAGAYRDEGEASTNAVVRVVEDEERQHEIVCRGHISEHVRGPLVQDHNLKHRLPPACASKLLEHGHLRGLLLRPLVADCPQVDARMQHVHRDKREDDTAGPTALVLDIGRVRGEQVDPTSDGGDDNHRRPILHDCDRDLCQVAPGPSTDVLPIQEIADEVLSAGEDGEPLDRADHEEELVGTPNVVHGQERDLVRIDALHD